MEENVPFNSLDPLGPEFGRINSPIIDSKGLAPFEGERSGDPKINFPSPEKYFPSFAGVQNLDRPNRGIEKNVVKTNAVNPSIPHKPYSPAINKSRTAYLDSYFQANQDKNSYGKMYSYNAGPDGNAFYKRYAAYGQQKFDEIGFSPLRDNEANFNARTTRWDDFSRMMSHSFVPLLTSGFTSGPKSLAKMMTGDFSSGDLEEAKMYEEATAIGQSNKGGVFGFVNNATMNFGYTAGIMLEAIAEEAAGALLAAPTGGSSLFVATANNALKFPRIAKGLSNGYKAVKTTLSKVDSLDGARNFWNAAKSSEFLTATGRALNPLENTFDAIKGIRQADNLGDLAKLYKTAGGFYRDVRSINMAISEARLEAAMDENHVYNKLYNNAYLAKGEVPDNAELAAIEKQSKDASYDTWVKNVGLIYASNAITFNNITSPRGGIRNFMKNVTDDVVELSSKPGAKNFGTFGKVVYDRTTKTFAVQKNNLKELAKSWLKQPVYKSAKNTVGYFKSNFTEGIQENLQEVIAGANERYYVDSYKSPALKAQLYSQGVMGQINKTQNAYLGEELANQFSGQGAETFASGFFMGTLAGPLNAAVPFLSSGYNKMFDKEGYNTWKTTQAAVAENLTKTLNDMDLKTFTSDRNLNLGAQDLISKIRQRGNKKKGLDAETEAYITQVNLMRQTGTGYLFKEKLTSFNNATDKEFAEAFAISEEEVPKYRGRINLAVERLDRIEAIRKREERKNPNPVSAEELNDKDAPDYTEKVLLHNAWEQNIRNAVFFHETYNDAKKRRADIQNKYSKNSNFNNIQGSDKDNLFNPINLSAEIELLNNEIEMEKELGKEPKKLKTLNEKSNVLQKYLNSYVKFDIFFNRADQSDAIKEELQKELGKEPTAEEIAKRLDEKFGDIEDEDISGNIIGSLKEAHDEYVKTLAKQKGDVIFDENTNEAFEMLLDYYKLGHEAQAITQYINLMNNPESFIDLVRRNQEWLKHLNNKKVKYFEDLVNSEMGKVRDNAFLNKLADNGYFMNEEDMANYLGEKNIPPKEIYNHITKEVYPQNSDEYNRIYAEFFSKRAELKAQQNPKKSGIIKSSYETQIEELNTQMQNEIDSLPTTPTRVDGEPINKKGKNKTLTFNELYNQLGNEEYAEVDYKNATEPMIFYKDINGEMHYDDNEGELVDFDDITVRFTDAIRFTYTEEADPKLVKAITDEYEAKIAEIQKAYTEDLEDMDEEIPYEELTQDTDLTTPDLLDFRNNLYETYINEYLPTLSEEEQTAIAEDDTLDDITFEKWYKLPKNKKYFDEYNNKNRPAEPKENITFTFEGQNINTEKSTLPELISYRDRINKEIEDLNDNKDYLDDVEDAEDIKITNNKIKALKVDIKNINSVIKRRQFGKFSPVIREGVKKIQKLLNAQKGVEEKYLLKEDDADTGLKAGEVAYRVNGKIHRRVTKALQDVLGEDYRYTGDVAAINKAYDLTIAAKGLTTDTIDDFISQLSAVLATKSPGYNPLPGVNQKFLDKLEAQLKMLTGLSKEQIDIERAKDKILAQMDSKTKALIKAEEDENETRIANLTSQRNELIEKLKELDQKAKELAGVKKETTETEAIAHNTTKDIIMNFFKEESYQDSRDAGNFVDDAKDYLETGIKPKFDSKKISEEAYDNLFNESTGYLTQLKRKVDSGEFYLIGRDLVVFDSNIVRPDGTIDRIAGEIDLLLATDKGIMIVDIKSGEPNKWMNFNKLSTPKTKVYSKREEYTLQQGAYATMLEKMINAPVAAIALLPVERGSDSESNQMLTASKPLSVGVYDSLVYEKDTDGSYKRNDQGELVFKSANKRDSQWFIPLYKESVQDKLDIMFPQKAVKLIPGLTSLGENQFNVYRDQLNTISEADTKENRKALENIEKNMTEFLAKNPVAVPEDITVLMQDKKAALDKAYADKVLDNAILKYEADADKADSLIKNINKRLSQVEIDVDFSNIDLSESSDFIQEQLEEDAAFKNRFETHEKYFDGKYGKPTEGQEAAITNLASTGTISPREVAEYKAEEKTRESASLLIHEAVKRIQYLVANTEDTLEAEKLRIYQKDIISLMFNTKNNTAINKFISTLNNIKEDVDNGNLNNAVTRLDIEILKLESDLSGNLKDYTKKALENKLADMQKVKTAVTNLSNYRDIETDINLEEQSEEDEVVEEFEIDPVTINIIKKGDVIFSKSGNFARYTVAKVEGENITLTNEEGKKINTTMSQINKDYLTEEQILGLIPQTKSYEPTTSEDKINKESLTSIDDFVKSTEEKDAGYAVGTSKTAKQIRKELREETKNCQ